MELNLIFCFRQKLLRVIIPSHCNPSEFEHLLLCSQQSTQFLKQFITNERIKPGLHLKSIKLATKMKEFTDKLLKRLRGRSPTFGRPKMFLYTGCRKHTRLPNAFHDIYKYQYWTKLS